jgi:hypothetical protein
MDQVNVIWNPRPDSSSDGDHWTIILTIPASFYNVFSRIPDRRRGWDPVFLMKPLESSFPMLVSITSGVISRSMAEWTAISDYIETFVASQFTFLEEEQHDLLLFDDDTFSRSRQYFWVITTISEFIPIIDQTLKTREAMNSWGLREENRDLIPTEDRWKLEAIKERFESQKKRAEALRDGVSLTSRGVVFQL